MNLIILGVSLILIIGSFAIILREMLVHHYNPLPKFENGDKNLDEIRFVKTRKIEACSQWENKND